MLMRTLGALALATAIGSALVTAVDPAAVAAGPTAEREATRAPLPTTNHFLRAIDAGHPAAARKYATRALVHEYLGYHRDGFRFRPAERCGHRKVPGYPRGWQCGPAEMTYRGSVYARVYFYLSDRHPQRVSGAGIEESSRPVARR